MKILDVLNTLNYRTTEEELKNNWHLTDEEIREWFEEENNAPFLFIPVDKDIRKFLNFAHDRLRQIEAEKEADEHAEFFLKNPERFKEFVQFTEKMRKGNHHSLSYNEKIIKKVKENWLSLSVKE